MIAAAIGEPEGMTKSSAVEHDLELAPGGLKTS